jgi:ribose 5-phosphate isomerase B
MKIYIASDHGGYFLKEELKKYLLEKGHKVEDVGNTRYEPNDDYPNFIFPLAQKVARDKSGFGVVLGRSGVGEMIAANKVKGIRAAVCFNQKVARKAREHNNANIISFGADYVGATSAKRMLDVFLRTHFSQAKRHRRRVEKITRYESAHIK